MPVTYEPGKSHPARLVLFERGIQIQQAAAAIGCAPKHLSSVLARTYPATPQIREALAEFLGEPESALFHEESDQAEAVTA